MCVQKRELLGWIRAQIHLCRLDAGMAEPERDLADIAGGLKRVHGTAVPQYMRGDVLCRDRRDRAFGYGDMLPDPDVVFEDMVLRLLGTMGHADGRS